MIFSFRPQFWEPGVCPERQPKSAETSCISSISYLKTRKEIKEQKKCILKSHGRVFCWFLFGWFFLSWPHEFHSWTHEYVVLYLSSSVNMQESWQSRGVMMKDKYSLIIILVSLNKENALVSETV